MLAKLPRVSAAKVDLLSKNAVDEYVQRNESVFITAIFKLD